MQGRRDLLKLKDFSQAPFKEPEPDSWGRESGFDYVIQGLGPRGIPAGDGDWSTSSPQGPLIQ